MDNEIEITVKNNGNKIKMIFYPDQKKVSIKKGVINDETDIIIEILLKYYEK